MGERLQVLLEEKTGVTWYRQNVNANGVGDVFLSRYPPCHPAPRCSTTAAAWRRWRLS